MSDKTPPILEVVKNSNKPDKKNSESKLKRFGTYQVVNNAFFQIKSTKDGEVEIPLADFVCQILEEITHDDGLEDKAILRISGTRQDGLTLPEVEIQATKFYSSTGNWANEAWGTKVFIYPGSQKKDNLRAAILLYSRLKGDIPNKQVYGYTGWKRINDDWYYLTGSGGIGANGLVDQMQVELGNGHMSRYQLPRPLDQAATHTISKLISELLAICPSKPHVGAALLAAVARAPLGECHPTDFAVFIHGLTGAKKSCIAAIALAFFGQFNARSFPANWSDTENDTEAKGFAAKDSIFVVDDFKPSVNTAEAAKLHGKAERFIRNTGNQAGRGRRGADMQARPAPYNRSLSIITAEDLPKGPSLLGRMLIIELRRDDVDVAVLTRLQKAADSSELGCLMSAYLQWMASQMDELKKDFPLSITTIRDSAIQNGFASSHPRASEIYANLVSGAEVFLNFLTDIEVLSTERANVMLGEIEDNLQAIFKEQGTYHTDQDEVERFLELLRSALSSGNAHVACRLNQGPPTVRPHSWGWRSDTTDLSGEKIHKRMGDQIGWYSEKDHEVWLDKTQAFATAQQLARAQGDMLLLSASSLWRRMDERRLILQTEMNKNGSKQLAVKRVVGGNKKRVLILSAELIESS